MRLLGISVSNLKSPESYMQPSLFEKEREEKKKKKLNQALDRISEKFGEDSVLPATLMKNEIKES